LIIAFAAAPADPQDFTSLVSAPDRTEADRQNDKKRDPVKLLAFVAPKPGWHHDCSLPRGHSSEKLVLPDRIELSSQ
jgi:hypothetical protein